MSKTDTSREYIVDLFSEEGFVRRKCRVCGRYFWTLNPDLEVCGDSPCTKYYFDRIRTTEALNVRESRNLFLKFFERKGHKIIPPRPVVARWREDLYLTIASIVVFQPHVTSGLSRPPANPLVISQPCIRLEDIDNVGYTLGRHLTLFEMGGHHAFNSEKEHVYWKNETVRLAYEFFTKEIKVHPEEITFKESWWEGGGNAGPCFEVAVGGLEVATLVFMKYRVLDGSLEDNPLKIVDTGYGIERISWLTSKTPTAFHAIYGDLMDFFRRKLNVDKLDEEVYKVAFKEVGLLEPESEESFREFINRISRECGIEERELLEKFEKEARLYTMLDHTKTIAFMLADGVVPSNQGEGYLARLVIRRALKTLYLLKSEAKLQDLVEKQVIYWGRDFPRLKENLNYILDVLSIEEEKFRKILEDKLAKVLKLVKKKPSIDTLRKIYEEHGIPPEILADKLAEAGVVIHVPRNFFSILAREGKPRVKVEGKPSWVNGLPKTTPLFHENPYAKECIARVLAAQNSMVVLDKTIAYPEGGGQECDYGWIIKGNCKYRFKKVVKYDGVIVHVLDCGKHDLKPGDIIKIVIDWDRRYRLMKHHTATHIILGALRKVLGNHVWQAGAEKTIEKGRLDFTHYKPLSRNELLRIESEANKVVCSRLKVNTFYMDRNEAEEKYGYTLYQGGAPLEGVIRVVEIPGHDVEACYGTHVSNTGEIGCIKIIGCYKLQDGVYRVEYTAGASVAEYAFSLEDILSRTSALLGCDKSSIHKRVESLLEELKSYKNMLSSYRVFAERYIYSKILGNTVSVSGLEIAFVETDVRDEKLASSILKKIANEEKPYVAFKFTREKGVYKIEISVSKGAVEKATATSIVNEARREFKNARGGGKSTHALLLIPAEVEETEVKKKLVEIVSRLVRK